jgi:hypothetical protein
VKTGNEHGPELRMRRHVRRWSTRDSCKLTPSPIAIAALQAGTAAGLQMHVEWQLAKISATVHGT